ncbi:Disks large [Dirofilaria immitis]
MHDIQCFIWFTCLILSITFHPYATARLMVGVNYFVLTGWFKSSEFGLLISSVYTANESNHVILDSSGPSSGLSTDERNCERR